MRTRWTEAFQIAAVYVGTVVGAGFATGKEIVEFFSKYGLLGVISILIAGLLFIGLGTKLMLLSANIGARSYEELNAYLFGKKAAVFVNLLFFIMLLGVTSVMLSGAGAVFEEQLGISKLKGILLTVVLSLFILTKGIKGLFAVNSFVVPIMIFFSVIMCMLSITHSQFFTSFINIPENISHWNFVLTPFSYAAFNLALAQAVLVPVAYNVKNEGVIRYGGILGGTLLALILLCSHVALVNLPNFSEFNIPTAEIMKKLAPQFYWIYVLIIYGEIFTSIIGNAFGLEKQASTYITVKPLIIFVSIFIIAIVISRIQYGVLLSILYPLFGYISLLFLFLLYWKSRNR
ncbi:YkvI family membrane protein [Peribacillus tepidiphilus]|jgi:uncharacterized membrane protein YkvI|uniref:YkvI family membrane protein n=1 Tax=Peribacillus tepidiphilus TaxID=2652445 RepID=UPI0035B554B2